MVEARRHKRMEIARGDIVVAVLPGEYGKVRPGLIVQSDAFNPTHSSMVVCPITSHLLDAPLFRLRLKPSPENGLEMPSEIMIDKMMAIKRERVAKVIGRLSHTRMQVVDRALETWLSLD
jgi:mRNA interferase MazF